MSAAASIVSGLPSRLGLGTRRVWAILCLAVKTFLRIDGEHWAGAFAFSVFCSLFPLMVLFVTIASSFIDRDRAGKQVIAYMENCLFRNVLGVFH